MTNAPYILLALCTQRAPPMAEHKRMTKKPIHTPCTHTVESFLRQLADGVLQCEYEGKNWRVKSIEFDPDLAHQLGRPFLRRPFLRLRDGQGHELSGPIDLRMVRFLP